eukprot:m.184007 g.184007  ORF g.184007 m.184007 type:complete len:908 (-) comp13594_c0_seq3:1087-3810(-)
MGRTSPLSFRTSGRCAWVLFSRLIILCVVFGVVYSAFYGNLWPQPSTLNKSITMSHPMKKSAGVPPVRDEKQFQGKTSKEETGSNLHKHSIVSKSGNTGSEAPAEPNKDHHQLENSKSGSNHNKNKDTDDNNRNNININNNNNNGINKGTFSVSAMGTFVSFKRIPCAETFMKRAQTPTLASSSGECETLVFSRIANKIDLLNSQDVDGVVESILTLGLNKTKQSKDGDSSVVMLTEESSTDICAIETIEERKSLASPWERVVTHHISSLVAKPLSVSQFGSSFDATSFDYSNAYVRAQLLCFTEDKTQFRLHWAAGVVPSVSVVRLSVQIHSLNHRFAPRSFYTVSIDGRDVTSSGSVKGSPIIQTKSRVFLALEHPLSGNGRLYEDSEDVICGIFALPRFPAGTSSSVYNTIIGSYKEDFPVNKAFWEYLEAARASPSRPFLHYNSWFDFYSWQEENPTYKDRTMTARSCQERVRLVGEELVDKRNVVVDSFLWDDGWDDHKSLWSFHSGFPDGFTPVSEEAKKIHSGIGVWVSPWGGYGSAKKARLTFAKEFGYETNKGGFSLSGEKYFNRFSEIALNMVEKYGVNMFKFDGIGFAGNDIHAYATEVEGLMNFLNKLRGAARNAGSSLWLNLTTGMWPSPFWLLYGDSIWRGFGDLGYHGEGTERQRWVTYRDAVVCKMVVMRAHLFPLSALMLHGIVLGAVGESRVLGLDTVGRMIDFEEEVWSYFAMGVQLQELYISPDKVPAEAWDVIGEAAKWARLNSRVLKLSHWVGGNAVALELYGFVSQVDDDFILFIRNPTSSPTSVSLGLGNAFNLPKAMTANTKMAFICVFSTFSDKCHTIWKEKESQQSVTCETNTRNAKSGNKIVSSSHGSLETECVFDAKTIYNTQIPAMGSLLLQGVRLN